MTIQDYTRAIERHLNRWLTDSEARLAGQFLLDGLPADSAALAFGAAFSDVVGE